MQVRPQLRIIQGMPPKYHFRLPEGREVYGDDYTEVVQAMSEEKLSTPRSLRSYRRAVARRMGSTGIKVNTVDDEHFVRSLVVVGVLVDLTSSQS